MLKFYPIKFISTKYFGFRPIVYCSTELIWMNIGNDLKLGLWFFHYAKFWNKIKIKIFKLKIDITIYLRIGKL